MAGPVENMLAKKIWAVVGASENTQKFGYKIAVFLHKKGYKVYGVNPNTKTIKDIPCYPDLASLPEKPDVVNFVVPPPVTAKVVAEGLEQGISNFWVQPGAGDDAVLETLMRAGTETVFNHCVMAEMQRMKVEGIKENLRKITKLGGK
jgi:uncharacterized protein